MDVVLTRIRIRIRNIIITQGEIILNKVLDPSAKGLM